MKQSDSDPFKGLAMTLDFVRFQALGLDVDLYGIVWKYGNVGLTVGNLLVLGS